DNAGPGFPFRFVSFSYGRVQWQLLIGACTFQQQAAAPSTGCLRFRDTSTGGFRGVVQVPARRDAASGSFVFTIEKLALFNENRLPARFGERLVNISATTQQYFFGGFNQGGGGGFPEPTGGVYAGDVAPQSGELPVFAFLEGSGGHGHLGLSSADPIRVTNGEATTLVYQVQLFNDHSEKLSVQIDARNAPSDWTIRSPALLTAEPHKSVAFPVILSMPFRHDHGKVVLFTVGAQAVEDPDSYATTELGVFWTDVPQPSGHHECDDDASCGQWFHSAPNPNFIPPGAEAAFPVKSLWFNGIAKDPDPDADDANIPAFFNDYFFCLFAPTQCKAPPVWTASWFFPQAPQLLMGLDFDLSRTGIAKLHFLPKVPEPTTARIDLLLLYCDPSKQGGPANAFGSTDGCYNFSRIVGKGSRTFLLQPMTDAYVEVPITIEPGADLIPYKRGANIGFGINVTSTLPQNVIFTEPRIEFVTKASHIHLPVLEYHDPIDAIPDEFGLVVVQPQDPFEKQVNPGRTAAFRFNLINDDDIPHHFALSVEGVNNDWARIGGAQVLLVPSGGETNFTLAVTAPDDAQPTERAELFVVAQSEEESWVVALSRLRATVVDASTADIPDESGQVGETQENEATPGVGAVWVAVAVGASSLMRRHPRARRGG
ncbi:MAG TPA: hypothetical protein VI818_04235, partial [Candidatus Thermoplasmatota archaeon]|nr:hypothetical protein [Candidatus Thermoplasmatota archaeon]